MTKRAYKIWYWTYFAARTVCWLALVYIGWRGAQSPDKGRVMLAIGLATAAYLGLGVCQRLIPPPEG